SWKFAQNMLGNTLKKDEIGNDSANLPSDYRLDQNYPNPFNPSTKINYQLPEKNYVTLRIYDIIGNLVATLVDQEMEAGYYSVTWNAGNIASGIYLYRFTSGNLNSTKKLLLLK
ncbi:MAG TPA: T9SS type A sorting domain-containing protein, partial [Ignavibacteriaceae bacterium]|nr:T9SS type A sorting domain-containing protein [Ignavibacteriaceae bacterium]